MSAPRPDTGIGSRSRTRPIMTFEGPSSSRRRALNLPIDSSTRPNEQAATDTKFEQIMSRTGKITFNGTTWKTDIAELEHLGELGNGTCGHVVKMKHRPSNQVIAVKQMRRSGNVEENKRIIMDLEVVLKSHDCPFIVKCLGCFITDADVWICMELMTTCMDKLLKTLKEPLPENVIGKVTVATVKALHYLKEQQGIIHRDVKPSNILIDDRGNVKLCDFGISGHLIDSKAQTRGAGCTGYMAPERINPPDPSRPVYDIRADVWSLGITLVELATGLYPYSHCANDFEVMTRILQDTPPELPPSATFSAPFRSFVHDCLVKNYLDRPKYRTLLAHPFLKKSEASTLSMSAWYEICCAARTRPLKSHFNQLGRHSGRLRPAPSLPTPTPSPITPSPGSARPPDCFFLPSPSRPLRSNWDRLNSDSSPHSTGTTPGTPSPLHSLPPDPPPRLSRVGGEGLRTPTPTSSSGLGSSSGMSGHSEGASGGTPNSGSPSPDAPPPPPIRRLTKIFLCYPGC